MFKGTVTKERCETEGNEMTQSGLERQVEELCDVLQQLSRPSLEGPCWCSLTGAELMVAHAPICSRARFALMVARAHLGSPGDPAPGYGFGV